jgi:predicted lactoylglutathione lyase
MEPKFIWANLVSNNIEATTKFYAELGFAANGGPKSDEATSFVFGQNKFVINFFTRARLRKDVNGNLSNPISSNEVMFSLSAQTRDEVDEWADKVVAAGGTVFSEAQEYEKGYTLGFADPDGHKFNVLYWPGM